MEEPLKDWISQKNHVTWGTCAGMILLSKEAEHQKLGGQSSVLSFSLSLCTGLSACLSLCNGLSACLSLCTGLSACLSLCTSLSACLSLFTGLSACLSLFTGLSACLSLCTGLSAYPSLYTGLSACLSLCTGLSACLSVFQSALCLPFSACLSLSASTTTRGVTVSTSAFLACHQYYCAGSSLAWGLNLRAVACGIFWSLSLGVFSWYSGFLPSFIG